MSATMIEAPAAVPPGKDPLRELVERMDQMRLAIVGHDPKLSSQIEGLAAAMRKPEHVDSVEFRTRVAYVYQDFKGLAGPAVGLSEGLRSEMERLAATAPGLGNLRIHDMLKEIPNLNNSKLTADIRKLAFEVGREGGDQNRPDVLDRVESLESRLALLGAGPTASRNVSAASPSRATDTSQPQAGQPPVAPASKPDEKVQASMSPGEGIRPPPGSPVAQAPVAAPPSGGGPRSPDGQSHPSTQPTQGVEAGQGGHGPSVLGRVVLAMAEPREENPPPWRQPATPIGDRINRFVSKFSDESAVGLAEASGQKAVEALRSFAQGAGAGVMARINEAARSDPQGMQGVLSEMREGGRHAELRTQFNNALVQDKGVAASYDAATSAVKQYGADRQAAEAVMLKRPDPSVLAGRFERLDAQIGEAAVQVPARQEGKSVMDDLGQKVAELVRRATEAIRSALEGGPRASASASSSPSPGP